MVCVGIIEHEWSCRTNSQQQSKKWNRDSDRRHPADERKVNEDFCFLIEILFLFCFHFSSFVSGVPTKTDECCRPICQRKFCQQINAYTFMEKCVPFASEPDATSHINRHTTHGNSRDNHRRCRRSVRYRWTKTRAHKTFALLCVRPLPSLSSHLSLCAWHQVLFVCDYVRAISFTVVSSFVY